MHCPAVLLSDQNLPDATDMSAGRNIADSAAVFMTCCYVAFQEEVAL